MGSNLHVVVIPPPIQMLSIATTGTFRRWTGQALSQSANRIGNVPSHHCLKQATVTRGKAAPTVFCRYRHAARPSTRPRTGSWDAEPVYNSHAQQSRPAFRPHESGRAFGGEEFSGAWETTALKNAVERFQMPRGIQQHLESLGTSREKAKELISDFSSKTMRGEVPEVSKKAIGMLATQSLEVGMTFKAMGVTREEAVAHKLDKVMWDAFFTHCESMFPPDTLFRLTRMRAIADLRFPVEWSPAARLMKRKIVMHVGPTNSGKTHNALLKLQAAESGAYLSPLRLLAHEVFERMNKEGTPCNLVTGEERRYGVHNANGDPEPLAAKVISSTIEMANFDRKVDVAVIDEIQMLADPDRGWAWTQALISLPAREIHLCGEPTVVELVKKICALANEDVIVNRYDRLSKLEVQEESLYGDFKNIEKGDCVVTFSRRNIFMVKKAIEAETRLRCAVAYGSLPPESRSQQAKLFNEPDSGYDVLVASDAIGMGLNLNIQRIIFEAVEKFDGSNVRTLSLTQLKQIAGRAGRFGTDYAVGKATTLLQGDIPTLKRALAIPMIEITRAAIQPTSEMIEEFSVQMPGAPFSHVLKMFEMMSRNSPLFFPAYYRNMIAAAELVDNVQMPVRERIPFISAPIQMRNPSVVEASIKMARAVGDSKPLSIDDVINLPAEDAKKTQKLDLKLLESTHRVIMLYLWLSQRFAYVMKGGIGSEAHMRKIRCEKLIETALKQADDKRLEKKRERLEKEGKEDGNAESKDEIQVGERRRKTASPRRHQ